MTDHLQDGAQAAGTSPAPLLSVGMPVYNGQNYLRVALDSLLSQDFGNFEVILCDNASTDDTERICREYAQRDPRIRYVRNPVNIGSSPNYNRTFELSRGKYFKWLAHDDVCYPGFLGQCVAALERAPETVSIVYPRCDLIDGEGSIISAAPQEPASADHRPTRRLANILLHIGYAYPLWGVVRSSHLRRTRLFVAGAHDDYVLLAELALQGQSIELPQTLFGLRMHANNAWGVCTATQGNEVWKDNAKADRTSRRRMLAWTNPELADRTIWLPANEELYVRYLQGIAHSGLGFGTRLACYAVALGTCYYRRLRNFAHRWKLRIRASWPGPAQSA